MIRDVTVCCKNKARGSSGIGEVKKRKRAFEPAESDESEDENWSDAQKKKSKSKSKSKQMVESHSDADSVDSQISAKRKRQPSATASKTKVPVVTESPLARLGTQIQVTEVPKKVPEPVVRRKTPPQPMPAATITPTQGANGEQQSAQIDCTPDLFSYLVNHSLGQTAGPSAPQTEQPSSTSTQSRPLQSLPQARKPGPRLAQSNIVPNPASIPGPRPAPRAGPPIQQQAPNRIVQNSIYHNYNGYRIDLQNAAQQSTVRLPSGKVIHVKRQTPLNIQSNPNSNSNSNPNACVRLANGNIVPASRKVGDLSARMMSQAQRTMFIQQQDRRPIVQRPPAQIEERINRSQALQHQLQQPPPLTYPQYSQPNMGPGPASRVRPAVPPRMTAPSMPNMMTANVNQQMSNVQIPPIQPPAFGPRDFGKDKLGKARTQLEQQIYNAISICHQIDGKLKTLMNSNAYKTAGKLNDVKELYIHLSYLFTYTNGRFKTLQDKCMDDMRRLGFKNDAKSLASGNIIEKYGSDADEDDIEIVEPNHQTINLDSDEERTSTSKKVTPEKQTQTTPAQPMSVIQPLSQSPSISMMNPQRAAMSSLSPMATETETFNHDISSSTEHLECDVDIAALLQPQIIYGDDNDDNVESLLTRMNDENEIATPPETEQTEPVDESEAAQVNIANDLKLNSQLKIVVNRVELEHPGVVEKIEELKNAMESPIENDVPIEADSSVGNSSSDLTGNVELTSEPTGDDSVEEISSSVAGDPNAASKNDEEKNEVGSEDEYLLVAMDSNDEACEPESSNGGKVENNENERATTSKHDECDESSTNVENIVNSNIVNDNGNSSPRVPDGMDIQTIDDDSKDDEIQADSNENAETPVAIVENSIENDSDAMDKVNEMVAEAEAAAEVESESRIVSEEINDSDLIEPSISEDITGGVDVAALLNSDDLENVSSPDTFGELARNGTQSPDTDLSDALDELLNQ